MALSVMSRTSFFIGYLAVFLPVVLGGCYLLQLAWPHMGHYQWILLGWKLLEQQGVDPFQVDYLLALPAGYPPCPIGEIRWGFCS